MRQAMSFSDQSGQFHIYSLASDSDTR